MKQTPKFVTKLFAAIDGYADIKAQNEQQALSRSARDTINPIIEHHNGVWMHEKNGGIFANFKLPEEAVKCAVAIQKEMSGKPDVKLRIGIHTGDIKSGIGTGDIVASKIAGSAALGGICISGKVYASIQNKTDVTAEYLEDIQPEGVAHTVSVYSLAVPGLPEPEAVASNNNHANKQSTKPSIVVLPFVDMSPDKDNEYFSDGLTEEIITDLSQIHDLLVISRSSAMTFKGTKKKIKEIAKEVNVQHVLEGSVRKSGNNLRITAQLIDAENDTHLWAEKYSGTLDDVFDIQEKVSRSIVDALKLKLSSEENTQIAERPIENVAAYEYYLKANEEITKSSEDAINHALRYLNNAINIIGDNAHLYSGMAFAYWNLVNIGAKQENYLMKAEEYAEKALLLNPESSMAHVILGYLDWFREKIFKSVPRFKKALEINRNEIFALTGISNVYLVGGKISAATPYCERMMEIDPLSVPTNWIKGGLYYYDGKFNLALQSWRKFYELHPENPYSQLMYALILTYNNETDKAISIIDRFAKTNPSNVLAKLGFILKYAIKKDKDKVFQEITPDFQKTCKRDLTYSHHLAGFIALINQKKEALDWLEHAVNIGFINYPFLNEYDPFLENIRDEERFKKLMERVKYEWEHFEV